MLKVKMVKKVSRKIRLGIIAGLLAASTFPFVASPHVTKAATPTLNPGGTPDYFTTPNYANSPLPQIDPTTGKVIPGTGIRKFVDTLPGLGAANANDLGQYIPVAVPDTKTYPGTDYYEISLVRYTEQMHKDLPPTELQGYEQTNSPDSTVNNHPSYFGPMIIAQKNRPVRIKFTNKLPTGSGGNLFLPVDTSLMGAGVGPDGKTSYTQNRATLHLHGGITPWISDGTPDQWITPAGENTKYPKGVSVRNVPDMPDPGDGSMTFFYTNQQSARLMWVHDHTYGITRLNVYAGEAMGYMLQDDVEKDLINRGIIPSDEMPLIIQDKTFVPTDNQLAATDPTWDKSKWGGFGNLWFPHVYMPNQNPYDLSGANPMGRWDYGPWFWPPNTGLKNGPVPNPLASQPGQPPTNPGVPNVSAVPESFMDTPVVNGTAYPSLTVQPKAYRFQVLNASNDRTWNLQLYKAKSNATMWNADGTLNDANAGEVNMVPAVATAGFPSTWPTDGRAGGVPDPAAVGPSMVQIGSDSGFLPNPVTLPNQPVDYDYNRRNITVLNVTSKTLLLGPAERADVVVDFSQYAGQTLILYNDAPAPMPGFDPRYDYYTGDPDQSATGNNTGGAPTTLPGYGPNTRTVMQITVAPATPAPAYDATKLNTELPAAFAKGQNPLISQDPNTYSTIQANSLAIKPPGATSTVTLPMQPKAIAEEFESNYGRMNATLGAELPNTNFTNQTTIPLGYVDPTTENLTDAMTPVTPPDASGIQIWKITHNGVDTHAVHFHLFDVQLINRVGWDGQVQFPDPNERGWKDTIRTNPLQDTIIALRPVAPKLPFGLPDSIRPQDPTMPLGSTSEFTGIDPKTGNPITVTNQMVNFGWEYVWHCHLLGHEENDFMRTISLQVNVTKPNPSVLSLSRTNGGPASLTWTDPTPVVNINDPTTMGNPSNEVGYNVMRAPVVNGKVGTYTKIAQVLANTTTYTDTTTNLNTDYSYRVDAFNSATQTNPLDPQSMYNSGTPSNTVVAHGLPSPAPAAPSNLTGTPLTGPSVKLTWKNNANNATGFNIQRSTDNKNFTSIGTVAANTVTYTDSKVQPGSTYYYRVYAMNGTIPSSSFASVTVSIPNVPGAPTGVKVAMGGTWGIVVVWNPSSGAANYNVQLATDSKFNNILISSSSSLILTPLKKGTNYYIRVRANNVSGSSGWSTTSKPFTP